MKKVVYSMALIVLTSFGIQDKSRTIDYNGGPVSVVYEVDDKFYGTYKGRKAGFLELKKDGNGAYKYDIFGFALPGCKATPIPIIWGFLMDEQGKPVRFEREYGWSYPILFQATTDQGFQGCRKKVQLDFIIERKDGSLGVSSSDDWLKQ